MVGSKDGFLTQFTPELVEKKRIEPPPGISTITDVFWHSTTLFLASYLTPEDEQPHVFSVLCAKNEPIKYADYQDICFGACEERAAKYFFRGIADWDLVRFRRGCWKRELNHLLCRKRGGGYKKLKGATNTETRCPKAVCGHRYPCPN